MAPKVVVEDNSGSSSRQQVNTSSASLSWSIGSSTSSMSSSAEDDAEENIFKNFMPKKSCLKKNYPNRHQLYIDTSNGGSGIFNSDNATSSPLVPATPTSPLSSSISSSPFFSSSSSSFQSPPSSSSHQSGNTNTNIIYRHILIIIIEFKKSYIYKKINPKYKNFIENKSTKLVEIYIINRIFVK